jgi:PhnB protein
MKIPEGYQTVMTYIIVENAEKFIDFLKTVFDAKEKLGVPRPEGGIMHTEVVIGDSILMLADATYQYRPRPAGMYIHVEDTDRTYEIALREGATSLMKPQKQSYASRTAGVQDEFGNTWWPATP